MSDAPGSGPAEGPDPTTVSTVADLGTLLRALRRREARRRTGTPLTYRELAARAGWSHGIIGEYVSGRVLPPADRFDELVRLLGADPAEQGVLATARDRVEENRRQAPTGSPVPRQLPADVPVLAGRTAILAALDARLSHAQRSGRSAVITLTGMAGVGKSTLAVHWARRIVDRFPDGQIFLNLRGFDPGGNAVRPEAALRNVLAALSVPADRMPADPDDLAGFYRSRLAPCRILILLDNAAGAEQVRPLLPGAPGCLILVTGRARFTGLVAVGGADPVTVDLLPRAEAGELLAHRLGPDRLGAEEPATVDRLVDACAGLPLALSVVAARAAVAPALPLRALVDELAVGRLDALHTGDPTADVRAVLSWSYLRLDAGAAGMFRLLGLHSGPEVTLDAAASLAGVPASEARRPLAELTAAHLVDEPAPARYRMHDLMRAYAAEVAAGHESATARAAARRRLEAHYLHSGSVAATRLHPARQPIPLPPAAPGVTVTEPADGDAATIWFTAERQVLIAAVNDPDTDDRQVWRLAWTLADHLDRTGLWRDWFDTQAAALAAARRVGDRAWQLFSHRSMAGAAIRLRDEATARGELERSLALAGELDDLGGQARAEHALGWLLEQYGRPDEAVVHAERAFALFERAGEPVLAARALNSAGWEAALAGNHEHALELCGRALGRQIVLDDRSGLAGTLDSLGYVYHHLGDHAAAADHYRQAIEVYRQDNDRPGAADTRNRLAATLLAAGDPAGARAEWQLALADYVRLGHPAADEVRAHLGRVVPAVPPDSPAAIG